MIFKFEPKLINDQKLTNYIEKSRTDFGRKTGRPGSHRFVADENNEMCTKTVYSTPNTFCIKFKIVGNQFYRLGFFRDSIS